MFLFQNSAQLCKAIIFGFLTARELAREVLVIAFSKVGQSRLSRGKSPSVGQSRVGYHCVILRKFSKV